MMYYFIYLFIGNVFKQLFKNRIGFLIIHNTQGFLSIWSNQFVKILLIYSLILVILHFNVNASF